MNKIDRDRKRSKKGSEAFDVAAYERHLKKKRKAYQDLFFPIVTALINSGSNLTEWELGFLKKIQDQLNSHGNISSKQIYWLEKIADDFGIKINAISKIEAGEVEEES